jgi:hypothetical protein
MKREDELERIGKETVVAYFEILPGIHLETQEEHEGETNVFSFRGTNRVHSKKND